MMLSLLSVFGSGQSQCHNQRCYIMTMRLIHRLQTSLRLIHLRTAKGRESKTVTVTENKLGRKAAN
mgnify:CR=1 FL=1